MKRYDRVDFASHDQVSSMQQQRVHPAERLGAASSDCSEPDRRAVRVLSFGGQQTSPGLNSSYRSAFACTVRALFTHKTQVYHTACFFSVKADEKAVQFRFILFGAKLLVACH
jgi:hypothetical protein